MLQLWTSQTMNRFYFAACRMEESRKSPVSNLTDCDETFEKDSPSGSEGSRLHLSQQDSVDDAHVSGIYISAEVFPCL